MIAAGVGLRPLELQALPAIPTFVDGQARGEGRTSYDIPAEDGVSVDRQAEVILVRATGTLFAFALSCPHQRSMLKWRDKDQEFKCTKHGSRYRPSGEYVSGRATRAMDRMPISIEGGSVIVDTSVKFEQDAQPQLWESAQVSIR